MAIFAPSEPTATAATRSPEGLTDSELVADVRRGSDRAFEQLYARYHRRIAAYVNGMVNDHARAEDIAQDVFMSALRRMRDTDRDIAFKPWIYEIAKNACIDQFRRARRGEEVSYDADEGLGAADYGRLVTTGPTPDAAVDQKLAIESLQGAFGGLSETHHQILVMREFEGLSYREIGKRLDMSRASVESTLFRARRRLGEEYEELVSGERCLRVQDIILVAVGTAEPGARDQRRLAAHLSHCQSCRRHARLAGLEVEEVIATRGRRAKIAAVLPLPAFLKRRWGVDEVAPVTGHHAQTVAQLSTQIGTVDPAVGSWFRATAAAATVAIAGITGGAAIRDQSRTDSGRVASGAPATLVRATAPRTPSRTPRVARTRIAPKTVVPRTAARHKAAKAAAPAAATPAAASAPAPASSSAAAAPSSPPALTATPSTASTPAIPTLDPTTSATGSGRPHAGSTPMPTPAEQAATAVSGLAGQAAGKTEIQGTPADPGKAVKDAVDATLLGG